MTPKEKAKELIEKYKSLVTKFWWGDPPEQNIISDAKQCAIIAVDEILNDYAVFNEKHKSYKVPSFWKAVKKAIESL